MQKQTEREETVLCAANAYSQKYYLSPAYGNLPENVQKELKLIAVDYTEEIGGIFLMQFNSEQKLVLKSMHEEDDLRFDDAHAEARIQELAARYEALFTKLETYYRALTELHRRGISEETGAHHLSGEVVHLPAGEGTGDDSETLDSAVVRASEQGGIRMTGAWDMPVMPDDPHAEQTAYRTLFGGD